MMIGACEFCTKKEIDVSNMIESFPLYSIDYPQQKICYECLTFLKEIQEELCKDETAKC